MAYGFKPDYPVSKHPAKCPTCGQRLPSDHAMITVDPEKAHKAMGRKGKKGAMDRGVGKRKYSAIEDHVRADM